MNVEDAYKFIALDAIESVGDLPWDSIIAEVVVYEGDGSYKYWAVTPGGKQRSRNSTSMASSRNSHAAGIFLRDDLLKTTGHLCYGFTFTLFKDGQFDIQYRYDNPYKDIEEQMAAEQKNKGNT